MTSKPRKRDRDRRIGPRPILLAEGLEQLLTQGQVARMVGCSAEMVRKMRLSGELPFVPVGGTAFFRPQDIRPLVAERQARLANEAQRLAENLKAVG